MPPLAPATPVPAGKYATPGEMLADKVARTFQDQTRRLEVVEKAVKGQGGTNRDVHEAFAAVRSKAAYGQERATTEHVQPLIEEMSAKKILLRDQDDYMTLLHKPTRDRVILDRSSGKITEGSGWTAADASARWAELEQKYGPRQTGKIQKLEGAADIVRRMREAALDAAVRGGLLSRDQVTELRATWGDDYVPQRTFEIEDGVESMSGTARGYEVRGKEHKTAHGRDSHADSPLSFTINQLLRTIDRAEKNIADQNFAKWVKDNSLYPVDPKHVTRASVDVYDVLDASGVKLKTFRKKRNAAALASSKPGATVSKRMASRNIHDALRAQKDYHYKVDGVAHRIDIASTDPLLDSALRNMSAKDMDGFMGNVAKVTRRFSRMVTTYTPTFMFRNFVRDVQGALVNVTAEQGADVAKGVLKGLGPALKEMHAYARSPAAASQMVREFREDGGAVGWSQVASPRDIEKDLAGKIERAGKPADIRKAIDWIGSHVENANKAVENATRFAVYTALRNKGVARKKAGHAARNVSIDFTKRGEAGPVLNSMYAFFNANVQGIKRMKEVAWDNPRGRAVVGGIVALGMLMDAFNRAMAGDSNNDGTNDYDAIPEHEKARKFFVMRGEGEMPITLPMPYGFNIFHAVGRQVMATMAGAQTPAKAATNVVGSLYNAFNPLGGESGFVQTITPTVLDPFVQHATNETWTGRPLKPEGFPGAPEKPGSEQYFRNVSPMAKAIASWLNDASGGDEVTPGYISVSPEVIAHYAKTLNSYLTGGIGREGFQLGEAAVTLAQGETPELRNIPLASTFLYEESPGATGQTFRANVQELETLWGRYKAYREEGDREKIAELPMKLLVAKRQVDAIENRIRKLRKIGKTNPAAEEQIALLQTRANRIVAQAKQAG